MAGYNTIHERATAALDYLRQAAVGLHMCGMPGIAQELQPVVEHLHEVIRENSRRAGGCTESVGFHGNCRQASGGSPTFNEAMSLEWSIDGHVGHRWSF